jgi:hypothetical protein
MLLTRYLVVGVTLETIWGIEYHMLLANDTA